MTNAEFTLACRKTLALLGDVEPRRDLEDYTSTHHLAFLLVEATLMHDAMRVAKANRWLGFAQGVMAAHAIATLDQLKRCNMPEGVEFDGARQ